MGFQVRFNDWDIRLAKYVGSVLNIPFKWGEHDCVTFANKAGVAQTGKGFADEFIGRHKSAKGAYIAHQRFLRNTGYKDIIEGFDDRLKRLVAKYPPIGVIVASPSKKDDSVMPWTFGVVIGRDLAFVGKNKLVLYPPSDDMMYWWPHE